MSGNITFPHIPGGTQLRTPGFFIDFDNTAARYGSQPVRALIVGQSLNSVPAVPFWARGAAQVAAFCDPGSQVADMAAAWFANATGIETYVLPFTDDGNNSTGHIDFSGTTTAAGTIPLYVADIPLPVAVPAGTAAINVPALVVAVINASLICPVYASDNEDGTVFITSKHQGTIAGHIDMRLATLGLRGGEAMPPGLACSITQLSAGSGDPDYSVLASVLADDPYDFIILGLATTTVLNAVESLLNDTTGRWAYNRQIYGHAFAAVSDSASNLLDLGSSRNDPHVTVLGIADAPAPPWRIIAAAVGAAAASLRDTPTRPLQTLRLVAPADRGLRAPVATSRFDQPTRNSLLAEGISTLVASFDGSLSIEDLVTTYRLDTNGLADLSYSDVPILYALMTISRRLRAALLAQGGGRAVLVPDGETVPTGTYAVTPSSARAALHAEFIAMRNALLVTSEAQFLADLVVEIDADNPSRLNVLWPAAVVKGLKTIAALNQFR